MSIKIYNGMKARKNSPFEIATQIRNVLEPVFLKDFKSIYLEYKNAISVNKNLAWDDVNYYFDDKQEIERIEKLIIDSVLYDKMSELHNDNRNTFSKADIFYDIGIYPNGIDGEHPLIMVFGEKANYYNNILLNSNVVEEYGYWDNSDPPESISDSQWAQRKQEWGILTNAAPIDVGLGITVPSKMKTSDFCINH